ncbi:MAG: hypothetical protein VW551_00475 [Euryarchaeota archaeon]|jgi:hypothetical protein
MALKVLRGTTAQRTGYTPEVGEPVWDTDTSKLYVGDGTTPGGVAVDIANNTIGLNDLTDVIVLAPPAGGQGLIYDAGNTAFVPGDPTKLDDKSINALSDVDLSTPATVGQVLKWDGAKFVPGDDNSVAGTGLVEGATYPINIDGTTFGDVYTADGGTQIINGTTGRVIADVYTAVEDAKIIDSSDGSLAGLLYSADRTQQITNSGGELIGVINTTKPATIDTRGLESDTLKLVTDPGDFAISIYTQYESSTETSGNITFVSHNGTFDAMTALGAGEGLGQVSFGGVLDSPAGVIELAPVAVRGELVTPSDGVSSLPEAKLELVVLNGPDINNAKKASLDHVGTFTSPIIQPGTYADATARDAAITSPAAGMMVFVTDVAKFQGYDGSAWVNLN